MHILFILVIAIPTIIGAVMNYEKISYKKYYERCEINSKHPQWRPWCGRNFFEEDPQWFVDNGYGDIIEKFYSKK